MIVAAHEVIVYTEEIVTVDVVNWLAEDEVKDPATDVTGLTRAVDDELAGIPELKDPDGLVDEEEVTNPATETTPVNEELDETKLVGSAELVVNNPEALPVVEKEDELEGTELPRGSVLLVDTAPTTAVNEELEYPELVGANVAIVTETPDRVDVADVLFRCVHTELLIRPVAVELEYPVLLSTLEVVTAPTTTVNDELEYPELVGASVVIDTEELELVIEAVELEALDVVGATVCIEAVRLFLVHTELLNRPVDELEDPEGIIEAEIVVDGTTVALAKAVVFVFFVHTDLLIKPVEALVEFEMAST